MRRISFIIALCTVSAFAFTNLKFTPSTVTMGEKTLITGNFNSVGGEADIILFLDDNANSSFDDGEIMIHSTLEGGEKFKDGGDDMDTVADGLAYIELGTGWGEGGAFPFAGSYAMIMSDEGGADTAVLVVKAGATTNTSVAGTVTGPSGGLANVMVFVALDDKRQDGDVSIGRTGSDGTYLIYVPDSLQGKKVWIGAEDGFDVLKGLSLIPPSEVEKTLAASNTGINFVFTQATQFVKGTVINETGAAVGGAGLWFEPEDGSGFGVDVEANGTFITGITEGSYRVYYDEWNSDEDYMTMEAKITVKASDDTVTLTFLVYTTNSTISGTITDNAGINLEDDFGLNVSVDTTGRWDWDKGVWFNARAEINNDGSFSVAVNSKFARYMLNTWADDLPSGYFVSPSYIDSVGPGQSGINIEIKEADQLMLVTVVDMANGGAPLANVTVQSWEQDSWDGIEATTDANGVAALNVYPGKWGLWLKESDYMKQEMEVEILESQDTTTATFQVFKTDGAITGTVTGDISDIQDEIEVLASGEDSTGTSYHNSVYLNANGTYSLAVAAGMAYYISVNTWNIPEEYIVTPDPYSMDYPYDSVVAGEDSIDFVFTLAKGGIEGKFSMTFPNEDIDVGVMAIDSSTGYYQHTKAEEDSTFEMVLPNGTYTVIGGYYSKTDTVMHIVSGVVVNDDWVEIVFYDTGGVIVPIIHTTDKNKVVFNLRNYPNPFRGLTNIVFSTPISGSATLKIYDLSGKMLRTLYSGSVNRGHYYFQFDVNDLHNHVGTGYYIARLAIDGEKKYVKNIRMILMK